jgi:hypothetical protein
MAEALQSQSTDSFVNFLREAGVSLAVSTYQAGKLILMREETSARNWKDCVVTFVVRQYQKSVWL